MSKKRLVYIAGVSDDESIGSYVKTDIDNLKYIFEDFENDGNIILKTDEYVTKRALLRRFNNPKILPWLFYFSGHSDEDHIAFSDAHIPADIFAEIFGKSRVNEELNLIYLGSCNSLSIGKKLIDNNVKMVIASEEKVLAHQSNIFSRFFFRHFMISSNVLTAFNDAKKDYNFDRTTFNVNQKVGFPWQVLTSSESNLERAMNKVALSAEHKQNSMMNTARIRLEILNYYVNEDTSSNKRLDLIEEEIKEIKSKLEQLSDVAKEDANLEDIIGVWKNTEPIIRTLPNKNRFLRTSVDVSSLRMPDVFIENTQRQVSDMINMSNGILSSDNLKR